MIEVNLFSIPANDNNARVGRCVARSRFDKEAMGVNVENFIKGFLKDNLDRFESGLGGSELANILNSDATFTRKDVSCVNHFLNQIGFKVCAWTVTDDEDNATGVPDGDVVEWNVIDSNFVQDDYPTATKIMPKDGTDILSTLHQIVDGSGLFADKFSGMKNPFTEIFTALDKIKGVTGAINSTLVSRVYETLENLGIEIFCTTSEN